MGSCYGKPKHVYIIKEKEKIILCTYDLKKAEALFDNAVRNRELIELHPESPDYPAYCLKHTYPYL